MADKHLVLQCDCHQGHFVTIDWYDWGDNDDGYFVLCGDFESTQLNLWDRLKGAWSVLFGGHWHYAEVTLSPDKLMQIARFLEPLRAQSDG